MTRIAKAMGATFGVIVGLFFIVRAVAEFFIIDFADTATYRNDWGGPSLVGVLLVHCGPGLLAALIITAILLRRRSARVSAKSPAAG